MAAGVGRAADGSEGGLKETRGQKMIKKRLHTKNSMSRLLIILGMAVICEIVSSSSQLFGKSLGERE